MPRIRIDRDFEDLDEEFEREERFEYHPKDDKDPKVKKNSPKHNADAARRKEYQEGE